MRGCLRNNHGYVTSDRRESGQWLKRFRCVPACEQQVEIEFGQKNGIAQIVPLGERRQQLAKLSQLKFAQMYGGGFNEKRGALRPSRVIEASQAKLVEELITEG